MAMRGVDDQAVDAGRHQHLGSLKSLVAQPSWRRRRASALAVLRCVRMRRRLLDVLDGDEAYAALRIVDHHELFDAVQMQKPAGLFVVHALADCHDLAGHKVGHRLAWIVGEAHIAIGQNADELRGLAVRPALDHGNARDRRAAHERERIGQRRVGKDGDRINDHPALEPLDLAHLFRLIGGCKIAVDDADSARFRHGDREPRLGHGVHRGGNDWQIEADRPGKLRSEICGAWHDRAQSRAQQDVVERKPLGNRIGFNHRHRHAPMWIERADGARLASAAWRGCLTRAWRSS